MLVERVTFVAMRECDQSRFCYSVRRGRQAVQCGKAANPEFIRKVGKECVDSRASAGLGRPRGEKAGCRGWAGYEVTAADRRRPATTCDEAADEQRTRRWHRWRSAGSGQDAWRGVEAEIAICGSRGARAFQGAVPVPRLPKQQFKKCLSLYGHPSSNANKTARSSQAISPSRPCPSTLLLSSPIMLRAILCLPRHHSPTCRWPPPASYPAP